MAEPMSLGALGRVLLRYWLLLVALTIVGAGAAYGVTELMRPVYTATALQLVKGLPGAGVAANYEASQYAVNRAKSYPPFVYSSAVLEGVRGDIPNVESVVDLRKELSATNPVDTPLIRISALGSTPEEARDKANSAARHLARFITQIETVSGKSPIIIETPVEAALPTETTSPRKMLITALGAVVGFVAATAMALMLGFRRLNRPKKTVVTDSAFDWSTEAADPAEPLEEEHRPDVVRAGPSHGDELSEDFSSAAKLPRTEEFAPTDDRADAAEAGQTLVSSGLSAEETEHRGLGLDDGPSGNAGKPSANGESFDHLERREGSVAIGNSDHMGSTHSGKRDPGNHAAPTAPGRAPT